MIEANVVIITVKIERKKIGKMLKLNNSIKKKFDWIDEPGESFEMA